MMNMDRGHKGGSPNAIVSHKVGSIGSGDATETTAIQSKGKMRRKMKKESTLDYLWIDYSHHYSKYNNTNSDYVNTDEAQAYRVVDTGAETSQFM